MRDDPVLCSATAAEVIAPCKAVCPQALNWDGPFCVLFCVSINRLLRLSKSAVSGPRCLSICLHSLADHTGGVTLVTPLLELLGHVDRRHACMRHRKASMGE